MMRQLIEREVRSFFSRHEPPCCSSYSCCSNITSDCNVSEEEPSCDQGFICSSWRSVHDVKIRRIESKSSGGKTISYKVDPEKLDRNQGFRETKSSRQEDRDYFSNIRRDKVSDELFHVVINSSSFFDCRDDGREVIICQDHLRCRLGNCSSRSHSDSNLSLL